MSSSRVVIVGGGLAGLACARRLREADVPFLLLEASDGVGGRVRTDLVDDFRLDRGFQVLLEAYPEARRVLDYDALELRPFAPGSRVRYRGRLYTVADPYRRPLAALAAALSPIGTLADKLRVAGLRRRLRATPLERLFARPETTTLAALRAEGFSPAIVERFFRPFLGGVFLDPELVTSSRMFEFVFRMFALGPTSLPAAGMQAIPEQLAAGLPASAIRTGVAVKRLTPDGVELGSGDGVAGVATVVATGPREAARLIPALALPEFRATTCLYYEAPEPPVAGPWLVLGGDGDGPINHLCVPSEVSAAYAPSGRALVSVTVVGGVQGGAETLRAAVERQLGDWFGEVVSEWRQLRSYHLPEALPAQPPGVLEPVERPVQLGERLFVCGDHRDQGSIQGALVSGRRAAAAVIATLT